MIRSQFGPWACRLLGALMLSVMAIAAAGAQDVPRERTMIVGVYSDGPTFKNPNAANPYTLGSNLRIGHEYVFEPMFYFNFLRNELVPWLAVDHAFEDDFRTVIVNLRDGVTWQDGMPFTAEDVAFTLNLLIEDGNGAKSMKHAAATAQRVERAEVVDPLTVRIHLTDPDPRYVYNQLSAYLGFGLFWLPKHVWEGVEDPAAFPNFDAEQGWPLGTGAWKVDAADPQSVSLIRDENWWGAQTGFRSLPEVERILVIPAGNADRAGQLAVNNEIDIFPGGPDVELVRQWLRLNPNLTTFTGREDPLGHVDWWPHSLYFNSLFEEWNDIRVRRAVGFAVDRQQLIDVAMGGANPPTVTPYPLTDPLMPYIEIAEAIADEQDLGVHDLERSAALMEEAGYALDSDGFWAMDGERLTGEMHSVGYLRTVGPLVAAQLRRGGFDVQYFSTPDSRRLLTEGRVPLVLHGHNGSIFDPVATLELYTSEAFRPQGTPTFAVSRWSDPALDALVEQMSALPPGDDGLKPLFEQAMRVWYAGLPEIPLQQEIKRGPMNTTYWENWPSAENPYIDPFPNHFGLSNTLIPHNLTATQ